MEKSRVEVSSGAALFYPILYFLDTAGWFAAMLPALLCHELGHLAAIYLCRGKIRSVRLDVTGLCMDICPLHRTYQEAICTAAGPLAGFLWIPAALAIGGVWGEQSAISALIINCFNLLPALPLDGGRILQALGVRTQLLAVMSLLTALALTALAARFHLWGLIIPAILIAKTAFTA